MVKFFLHVNTRGMITKVNWCSPEDLISKGDSLLGLFAEGSEASITAMLENVITSDADGSVITHMRVQDKMIPVTLFALKLYDQLAILGFDSGASEYELCKDYINTYNDFVNKIRTEFSKAVKERENIIMKQKEEIKNLKEELHKAKKEIDN